ncbi:MAG: hypothetical protein PHQ43_05965 [Dehalococcoidales bacterium]|nr:hypothetical protein [Dehalococcoidales bacterium]
MPPDAILWYAIVVAITTMVTDTTSPYKGIAPRAYGDPVGIRFLTALEGAGVDPFDMTQAASQGVRLGLTPRHIITLLHRLTAAGRLTRIKRGLYAINDSVTRTPRAHAFAIGTALVTPSAVSHWSALQHWGLTEQVPTTITISSPTRTYPPAGHNQKASDHTAWIVAGIHYEVIAVTRERFFGITQLWVNERNQAPIFDRERALLDAFHHFHIFGSLSVAMEILDKHLVDIDSNRLIQYALQLRVTAVMKRVGWALDHFHVSPNILEPLQAYPAKGESPLDPGRPARGRHNLKWNVIENLHDSQ